MVVYFTCPHCNKLCQAATLSSRESHVAGCKTRYYVFDGVHIKIPRSGDDFVCKCTLYGCRGLYRSFKSIKAHAETPGTKWDKKRDIPGYNNDDDGNDEDDRDTVIIPDSQDTQTKLAFVPVNPEIGPKEVMKQAADDKDKEEKEKQEGMKSIGSGKDGDGKERTGGGSKVLSAVKQLEGKPARVQADVNNIAAGDLKAVGKGSKNTVQKVAKVALKVVRPETSVVGRDVETNRAVKMAGGDHVSSKELITGDDLVEHADLQPLCLYFQSTHKLLACSSCWVLLTPSIALDHVKMHLPGNKAPVSQKTFDRICSRLDAVSSYPDFAENEAVAAISGLELYKEALMCDAGGCRSIYATASSMRKHHKEKHAKSGVPKAWKVVPAQHLNNNTHRSYFRVTPPSTSNTDPQDKWGFIKRLEDTIASIVRPAQLYNADPRNVSAWLKHTKWHLHAKGFDTDLLISLVMAPEDNEFPQLKRSVKFIVDIAMICVDMTPNYILRRMNTKDARSAVSHEPFQQLQTEAALKDYTRVLTCFVAFLVRDKGRYDLPLPNDINTLVQNIRNGNPTDVEPPSTPDSNFDPHTMNIFELLFAVWTRAWVPHQDNNIGDPTMCFVALSSIRPSGEWAHPEFVTPIIAKLFFCIRCVFLFHINVGSGGNADVMRGRYRDIETWLYEGEESTYNDLASLQHYASAMVYSSVKPPSFIWLNDEKTQFIWRGNKVKVSGITDMAMEIKRRMYKQWKEKVLCGLDIEIRYDHIADDLESTDTHYGFVDDARNKNICEPNLLMKRILGDPELSSEFVAGWRDNGDPIWRTGRLVQWLFDYSEFLLLFMASIEVTAGSPSRGTELTCLLYRNTPTRTRGIYAVGGCLAIVCQYSKTTSNTGRDRWLPHAVDGFDHDFGANIMFLAQPFAVLSMSTAKPNRPDLVDLWYTQLFVNFDRKFVTDDLSSILKRVSLSTMGVALGVRDYRQVSIAVRRAHCPTMEQLIGVEDSDAAALQAGHTRATEDRHYGITTSFLATLPEDLIEPFLKVSIKWQTMLKVPVAGRPIPWSRFPDPSQWQPRTPQDNTSPPLPSNTPTLSTAPREEARDNDAESSYVHVVDLVPIGQREWDDDLEDSYADVPPKADIVDSGIKEVESPEEIIDVNAKGQENVVDNVRKEDPKGKEKAVASFEEEFEDMVVDIDCERPGEEDEAPPSGTPEELYRTSHKLMSPREQQALSHLRSFLGDSSANWASPEQRRATLAAISRERDVIVALPTGAGKSAVPIVAASVRHKRLAIVSPFVALMYDWKRKLLDGGFRVAVYERYATRFPEDCDFLLATIDLAVTEEFATTIANAMRAELMDQLVIDEIQEVFIAKRYRDCMTKIWALRTQPFQVIALSGTLPASMETRLVDELHMTRDSAIIRASSNRPELQYRLEPRETNELKLLDRLDQILHEETIGMGPSDRGLIFVRSNAQGRKLAERYGCKFYSASNGATAKERETMVYDWRLGLNGLMVCTSAFGAGNDYPSVRFVILYGTPFEMAPTLQETGRAGRDRNPARCYIIPSDKRRPKKDLSDPEDVRGCTAIYETIFETEDCLRLCFTRYVDGEKGVECKSSALNQTCSRCGDEGITPLRVRQPKPVTLPPQDPTGSRPNAARVSSSNVGASSNSANNRPPTNAPTWGKKVAAPKQVGQLHRLSDLPLPVPPGLQPFNVNEFRLRGPAAGNVLVPNSSQTISEYAPSVGSQVSTWSSGTSSRGLKRQNSEADDVFAERAKQVKRKKAALDLAEEEYIAQLKRAIHHLEGKCTVCMVMEEKRKESYGHQTCYCPSLSFRSYLSWKKHVRYDTPIHGYICACCHVPQIDPELHLFISQGSSAYAECPYPDSTLPLVYSIYVHEPTRRRAQEYFQVVWSNQTSYAEWLCDHDVRPSYTNTMAVFLCVLATICRIESRTLLSVLVYVCPLPQASPNRRDNQGTAVFVYDRLQVDALHFESQDFGQGVHLQAQGSTSSSNAGRAAIENISSVYVPSIAKHIAFAENAGWERGVALDADGSLKRAEEIEWQYDPDEPEPSLSVRQLQPYASTRKQKRRDEDEESAKRRKVDVMAFLDIEAEVDDDEEEEEEGEEYDTFIDDCEEEDERPPHALHNQLRRADEELQNAGLQHRDHRQTRGQEELEEDAEEGGAGVQSEEEWSQSQSETERLQSEREKSKTWRARTPHGTRTYTVTRTKDGLGVYKKNWQNDFTFHDGDTILWEVRARSPHQKKALDTMIHRCFFYWPDSRYPVPRSIIWEPRFRDRIYIETDMIESARAVCRDVVFLKHSRHPKPIPVDKEDAYYIITNRILRETLPVTGSWIRFARGRYKGDLAYVFDINDDFRLTVVMVPRYDYLDSFRRYQKKQLEEERKRRQEEADAREDVTNVEIQPGEEPPSSTPSVTRAVSPTAPNEEPPRPPTPTTPQREDHKPKPPHRLPQAIFNPGKVHPEAFEEIPDNERLGPVKWRFEGMELDESGFSIVGDITPPMYRKGLTSPSLEELAQFSACSSVPREVVRNALRRLEIASLKPGLKVKVNNMGMTDYFGLVAYVRDDVAGVRLPGGTEKVYQTEVKYVYRWFEIGDRVKVVAGDFNGLVAWVVAIDAEARTAVVHDHVQDIQASISFHFLSSAPDDRTFLEAPSTSNDKGKERLNVPEGPEVDIPAQMNLPVEKLFHLLDGTEIVVAEGEFIGMSGKVLEIDDVGIALVSLSKLHSSSEMRQQLPVTSMLYRLNSTGSFFRLDNTFVLHPTATPTPTIVFQKLKGMDVFVVKGEFKSRWGTVHDISERGIALVSFPGSHVSSGKLQEVRVEHMLYRRDPGGAFYELDKNNDLQPAPHADKLILHGFRDLKSGPHPEDPDYQYDPSPWRTNFSNFIDRLDARTQPQATSPWEVGGGAIVPEERELPPGHFLKMLQERTMKDKPESKVMFKVREDSPNFSLYAGTEGYFVKMEDTAVVLKVTQQRGTNTVSVDEVQVSYQGILPLPPAKKGDLAVVCDTTAPSAVGRICWVFEFGVEKCVLCPSSRAKSIRTTVETWLLARVLPTPRRRCEFNVL
ncbi:hypothetical protein D9756_010116 [Leucocoprinus leucothites]|uniref:DNA 3'-5' helicase n=1 Tax=Leucocoprinus leucothites TaxID=201217 RepID=A0A8H5CVN7_9AGAR|nr:hypothetical protein D9756_010116 [Leucoagaricus leucothites]